MNPSAADWIPKFLISSEKKNLIDAFENEIVFYEKLKTVGFIYGVSVTALQNGPVSHLKLTKEEFTKINLFHSLLFTFFQKYPNSNFDKAIIAIINFYKNIEKGKIGFFHKFTLSQSHSNNLEQILASRLQEANNVLKTNTSSIASHTLFYVDVIAFREFLNDPQNLKEYVIELERTIISCCFLALNSKEKKNKLDLQLIELFESSSDYLSEMNKEIQIFTFEAIQYLTDKNILERKYLLDLCILSVHDDFEMDASEYQFLQQLCIVLQFPQEILTQAIKDINLFSEKNSIKINLFEYSNPVSQFYEKSSKSVKKLILRNKERLTKELEESGELLVLLGQSTLRNLTKEEKTKVKEQLLDICKSIPSLTIFLLPGGTILLPMLVKFIPKLLPSSFQDNKIDKAK